MKTEKQIFTVNFSMQYWLRFFKKHVLTEVLCFQKKEIETSIHCFCFSCSKSCIKTASTQTVSSNLINIFYFFKNIYFVLVLLNAIKVHILIHKLFAIDRDYLSLALTKNERSVKEKKNPTNLHSIPSVQRKFHFRK